MLAELLLLVKQPKVLFSSFWVLSKMWGHKLFVRNLEADDCSDFAGWNWMFLLSLLYPTVVRMINKDFVVVSCSAVMRSNNVMSWKVRGNMKRKIFSIYFYTLSSLLCCWYGSRPRWCFRLSAKVSFSLFEGFEGQAVMSFLIVDISGHPTEAPWGNLGEQVSA